MQKPNKTKKIYFILSYTGTLLSKIVRLYTKEKYSHISISLDSDLEKMYSFGRLNAYNPFSGGFVHENINWGTFKRFKKTKVAIYVLDVTEKQYQKIESIIDKMLNSRKEYRFNLLGLLAIAFHKKITRKKYFYCAEFIKYLIEESKIEVDLPEFIKPMDFIKIHWLELKYQGLLKRYCN